MLGPIVRKSDGHRSCDYLGTRGYLVSLPVLNVLVACMPGPSWHFSRGYRSFSCAANDTASEHIGHERSVKPSRTIPLTVKPMRETELTAFGQGRCLLVPFEYRMWGVKQ
jgi:hypothetical protein